MFNEIGRLISASWTRSDIARFIRANRKLLREIRFGLPWNRDILLVFEEGRWTFWRPREHNESNANGIQILDQLKADDRLISCLDLAQLKAVESMGLESFRMYFAGAKVCAWRSATEDYVPCLKEEFGRLVIYYEWLGHTLDGTFVTIRVL
jgi:hypothetical protein